MKYNISTCSFYKIRIKRLLELPNDFGVEFMSDFDSDQVFDSFLEQIKEKGNHGVFSIHGPFALVDPANDSDEEKLLKDLTAGFDLYHKCNAHNYVIHTHAAISKPGDEEYLKTTRELVTSRMYKLNEIAKREGVHIAIENLIAPLFNQEQFLQLFKDISDVECQIDVGHAVVSGYDIYEIQKALKDRISGYHLHNNNGKADTHARIRDGVYTWEKFVQGAREFTPNALGTFEYMDCLDLEAYQADREYLETLLI